MDGPLASTVINVKDHGAIGNGSADETNAIRAVIGASREGDAIYSPARDVPHLRARGFEGARGVFLARGHGHAQALPESEWFSVFDVRLGPVELHHLTLELSGTIEPPNESKKAPPPPPPAIRVQATDDGTVELVVSPLATNRRVSRNGPRSRSLGTRFLPERAATRILAAGAC